MPTTMVRMSDLLFVMKHRTLLMYHHKLDLAARRYDAILNMDTFVHECLDACQGTLDIHDVIKEAYGYIYSVVPDGVAVPTNVSTNGLPTYPVSPENSVVHVRRNFNTPPPHRVN